MGEVRDGRAETVAQRATKLVLQWPGGEPAAAPLRCDKRSADPYMSGSPVRPRGPGTMFHVEVPWFPQTHGCPSFLLNII